LAEERRQQSYEGRARWYDNPAVLRYVIEELRDDQSPDAIAGRMQRLTPWHKRNAISHESIYRYIWRVKEAGGCLHLHLPRKGKRPKFYGLKTASASNIPNRRQRNGQVAVDRLVEDSQQVPALYLQEKKVL